MFTPKLATSAPAPAIVPPAASDRAATPPPATLQQLARLTPRLASPLASPRKHPCCCKPTNGRTRGQDGSADIRGRGGTAHLRRLQGSYAPAPRRAGHLREACMSGESAAVRAGACAMRFDEGSTAMVKPWRPHPDTSPRIRALIEMEAEAEAIAEAELRP